MEGHQQGVRVVGSARLLGTDSGQRPVSSHGGGTREQSGVSFMGTLIPFMGLHPHNLVASPQPRLLPPSPLGLGFNGRILGGRSPIQSTAGRQGKVASSEVTCDKYFNTEERDCVTERADVS